ncbi:MAG: methylmalonyl-CoA mutase family protein [Bacteroidota bacterium]
MDDHQNLFSEFEGIRKEEWIAKITGDLKGRPFEDLEWQIDNTLDMSPVFHPEDAQQRPRIQPPSAPNNDWQIGESIKVSDAKTANALALEALAKGANALRFELTDHFEHLAVLLEGIHLSYISVHFVIAEAQTTYIDELVAIAQAQSADLSGLQGSWQVSNGDLAKLLPFLHHCYTQLPTFKALTLRIEQPAQQLSALQQAIRQASDRLHQLRENGLSVEQIAAQFQFSVAIGKQYFAELARLRALHLLWANLLQAYGAPAAPAAIEAHTDSAAYVDNIHSNMISATTQAMSAILGGIDRLYVLPANAHIEVPNTFTRRVARNLQHLLKMESYLDRVVDPAAGSYYIEELTRKMVEQSWQTLAQP